MSSNTDFFGSKDETVRSSTNLEISVVFFLWQEKDTGVSKMVDVKAIPSSKPTKSYLFLHECLLLFVREKV